MVLGTVEVTGKCASADSSSSANEARSAAILNASAGDRFPNWPSSETGNRDEQGSPPQRQPSPAGRAPSRGEAEGPLEPDEDYVSPALSRLERGRPRRSVIRGITEEPIGSSPPPTPSPRFAELDSRLDSIERHQ